MSRYVGMLQAIQTAIFGGMLGRVENLVFAEAFDDLLEQADYLSAEGYFLAAGVLGRAVLEEHLRKLCGAVNCLPQKPRATLNDYNSSLYDNKQLTKIEMKHIDALAAIGNNAAHNQPVTQEDVGRLLRDLRQFLGQHPP
ncbi:MAG TPA: DUF4145 domain-containing protein [Planctomycetaceae bacterium]